MNYDEYLDNTHEVNEKSRLSRKELVKRNKKLTLKLAQFNKEKIMKNMNKYAVGFTGWDR